MRLKSFLLITILLISLIGQLVNGSNLNQERPNFKYQKNNHVSSGRFIIGNTTDSRFEMLSTRISTSNSKVTITGKPTIDGSNNLRLNITGKFLKNVNINSRVIGTYFEVNDYLEEYNELERYRIIDNQNYIESDNSFETEFVLFRPAYNLFVNNNSFLMIENQRSGITAFILQTGFINNIKLNDTEGNVTGQILSFRINITILFFDSVTKKIRGALQSKDFGYGNIIPETIISHLKSNNFTRRIDHGSIGEKLLNNYRFSNIEWIDTGYNSTLGLYIYSGLYYYSRETSIIIFDNTGSTQSLTTSQIGSEFEEFQDELASTNLLDVFNDDLLNIFESELSEDILNEGGISISKYVTITKDVETIPNLKNLYDENIFFITQLTALLIATVVLIRRKKNS